VSFSFRILLVMSVFWAPMTYASDKVPRQPDFSRYPNKDEFHGKPAAPNLKSAKGARRFRTVLRKGAREGPNFAGHYTVVSWGCGIVCQSHAIVDARSGRVTMVPFGTVYELEYRLHSRLLVADPSEECLPSGTIGPKTAEWYEWNGTVLRKVDSVRIVAPCQ
jgi:hypothetical protein